MKNVPARRRRSCQWRRWSFGVGVGSFLCLITALAGASRAQDVPNDATRLIRYQLEGVDVEGYSKTRPSTVRRLLGLNRGAVVDVDDPRMEQLRWKL